MGMSRQVYNPREDHINRFVRRGRWSHVAKIPRSWSDYPYDYIAQGSILRAWCCSSLRGPWFVYLQHNESDIYMLTKQPEDHAMVLLTWG